MCKLTKEQAEVMDKAWTLVEFVKQLQNEGSDKDLPSTRLQRYVDSLADAVYNAEW